MNLGQKIRKLRKEQNRNLSDIADACGFSKSLLSKIENGKTVPPIATLVKIAETLGTKVSALLDDHDESGTIFTTKETSMDHLVKTEKGYSFFAFAVERQDKLMQPYLFVAKKGETTKTPLSHTGEEYIYVLDGVMKYIVGNNQFTLSTGDSIYFDSLEEHRLEPITDEVRYLAIFTQSKMNE
ncbi:helix-turn-helix domain-containing protein [Neobacillus cucumis]|uniref:XRE family transcriptional regulator n=1 Tax=Neobacillus cucumis TaxID=1740721 RepID=A0A2N5HSG1_9BACI|nr:XRE family transcriptional regulator [Neobacillus cucumis]PLS08417.1 XRE family transcriptional regulator [Neobacillus cucumis]